MVNRIILNETSYFGPGSRKVIAEEVAKRGYKKALVITDKDLVKFGVAAQVTDVLKACLLYTSGVEAATGSAAARTCASRLN